MQVFKTFLTYVKQMYLYPLKEATDVKPSLEHLLFPELKYLVDLL